jgi:hypothetical protein
MKFKYTELPISEFKEQQDATLYAEPNRKNGGFFGETNYGKFVVCNLVSLKPILLDHAKAISDGDQDLEDEYLERVASGAYIPNPKIEKALFLVPMPGREMSLLPLQPLPIVGQFIEWAPVARRRTKQN